MTNVYKNNSQLINWLRNKYEEDNLLRSITPTFNKSTKRQFDAEHGNAIVISFQEESATTTLTIYDDDIFVTHFEVIPGKDKTQFDTENYTFEQPHFDTLDEAIKYYNHITGEYLPSFIEE